jgi:hypothetical protein
MRRRVPSLVLVIVGLIVVAGCSVSTTLVPVLPEEEGRFGVMSEVRQPFYAEDDGLNGLTIRFFPDDFPGAQDSNDSTRRTTIQINYAPDDDPRFPEGAFHEWPDHQEWLPELTGDVSYEQTFCSPYPDLSGIQVRVATFGADISPGAGVLSPVEAAEVLELPIVGRHVGFLPGGSEVQIVSTTEGWVRVLFGDDRHGYVDMDNFEELPEPERVNDRDVLLELFDSENDDPIRTSVTNARDMHDNSHLTFGFDTVEDSLDECYRFRLRSPESEPGNAVTIRYDPEGPYEDGQAILSGTATEGDIVFQPQYARQEPLYQGSLNDYEWAAPLNAFEARFDPIDNTADRYLEVRIETGDVPATVPWSRIRPPGQRPLEVAGMPDAPQGGLIFNATFQKDVPLSEVARLTGRDLYSSARQDKLFFGLFGILLLGTVAGATLIYRRGDHRGR